MGGKIFGIGLTKTGTASLAMALRMLGYRTLHKGDMATSRAVDRAAAEGRPLLSDIGTGFDAYLDVEAIGRRFREADRQYPGSRFILTTRELDSWLSSRERHVLGNQERHRAGAYEGSRLVVDRPAWITEREEHHAAVHSYFTDRPGDLLVIDICGGEGWELLAPFLGRTISARPFPWENRDGAGSYRRAGRWQENRRRLIAASARFRRMLGEWSN
jgi:hypothetical protein